MCDELPVSVAGLGGDGTEAQRIHDGQRPRTHGEDVAEDAADAGGRALEWLDVAGVIVAFDFEGAGPSVADVDDAGVFARPLHHAVALGRQAFEMDAAGLIGAVLAPHDAVNAKFGEGWDAAEGLENAVIFVRGDAVLRQQLRGYGYRLGDRLKKRRSSSRLPSLSHETRGGARRVLRVRAGSRLRRRPNESGPRIAESPGLRAALCMAHLRIRRAGCAQSCALDGKPYNTEDGWTG